MLEKILQNLGPKLSQGASITGDPPSRWSAYKAPKVIASVKVANEADVAETVRYCNDHDLPFLAQNGGGGWATFTETKELVVINLVLLTSIIVSDDKKSAVIGGGVRVGDTVNAADAAGVLIQTGNCNSAGTLGVLLGGGYGSLLGQVGFGVDSILEMRVVTADGQLRTVSASQEKDLFWAMRGAGPNFGIVTSATVKAYQTPKEERSAWCGVLIYSEDKLEQVVDAIQNLELTSSMVVFMYYRSGGPPNHDPAVIVRPWLFQGNPETGKAAFKSLYDIGPMVKHTGVLPYTEWNTGANPSNVHSGRKPSRGGSLDHLDPQAWREVWKKYTGFQKQPTAHASAVFLEAYPMVETRFSGESSASFPHRNVRFSVAILPWYTDEGLDDEAVKCGKDIQELWRKSSGRNTHATYINFAHGDEPLEEIYGDSLPRLRELKREWDPKNRLAHWFNIR